MRRGIDKDKGLTSPDVESALSVGMQTVISFDRSKRWGRVCG